MKKPYKKKYEELLAKTQVDEKISHHTKRYIHIPFNWSGIGRFIALLGSLGLAIANFFSIVYTWRLLKLGNLDKSDITEFHQLLILYPIITEYILIGLSAICLTALIKGGFDKLNSYKEVGLIGGLIVGLIYGLIVGLIFGLFFGRIVGMIVGLIVGLIYGLFFGRIVKGKGE